MKNHYYENIRREFKSAPPSKTEFVNKIRCHHSFIEIAPTDLTWWSDFSFLLNGCYISVDWIHPRMAFQNAVRRQAFKQAEVLFGAEPYNPIFSAVEPLYKKIGKSRKKIIGWQTLSSKNNNGIIANVELIGSDEKLNWSQKKDALIIKAPPAYPSDDAAAFRITFKK